MLPLDLSPGSFEEWDERTCSSMGSLKRESNFAEICDIGNHGKCNIFVTGSCKLLYYPRCLERIKCCFEQALGTRLVMPLSYTFASMFQKTLLDLMN